MELTRRVTGFAAALALCIACAMMLVPGLVPGFMPKAQADTVGRYPLYIQGVQVTTENEDDILGDGTASFNPDTSTLTLDGFAITGQPQRGEATERSAIWAPAGALTVNLKGDNVIVGGNKGYVNAFQVLENLTFTGDGNLYAGGGFATDYTVLEGQHAISSNQNISFDENFTGVAVVQGPDMRRVINDLGLDHSEAFFCNGEFAVNGGTVIAMGGTCTNGHSIAVDCGSASITGGALVAQGGISSNMRVFGIFADNSINVTGGVLVARGGVLLKSNGTVLHNLLSDNRKAVRVDTGDLVIGDGMKVLGEVGYVDDTFMSDAERLDNGGFVTGIVVGPSNYEEIDELPAALEGDVYHISTDGTSFTTDAQVLDTAGHTALFVNLFESTDTGNYTNLAGSVFSSNAVSFTGAGEVISVGGLLYNLEISGNDVTALGTSYGIAGSSSSLGSAPLTYTTDMTVDGPTVVGVGGPAGKYSYGNAAKGHTVQSGNLVGVGGSAAPEKDRGNSIGIQHDRHMLTTYGTSKALGAGGPAGAQSIGLNGIGQVYSGARSCDSSAILAVGGTSSEGTSIGVTESGYANGGTVACIGGYAQKRSTGCSNYLVSYRGGKLVALGGYCEEGLSFGAESVPELSHAGDILVAGRARAFNYDRLANANYPFYSCLESDGVAWSDYDGTLNETPVSFSTTLFTIGSFQRIAVQGLPMFTVTFDANGGTGEMETVLLRNGDTRIILPENGFGEPAFKRFDTWLCKNEEDEPGVRIAPGSTFNVDGQATVIAQWSDSKWTRVAGDTRYDTMAAIVQQEFPEGTSCEWAVVASGENFPDALSASAIAGWKDCPIILSEPDKLTEQARSELERLQVSNIILMGGTAAISADVEDQLSELNGGISIDRVWGETRRETAVEAMRHVAGESDTVIVVSGEGYADALSIASFSCSTCSPILLTRSDGKLDSETAHAIADLGYKRFIIVGGKDVVDPSVAEGLADLGLIMRAYLAGADRYETSRLVAEFSLANGLNAAKPGVAAGVNFPDALAAAPMQATHGSIMVLVKDESSDGISLLVEKKSALSAGYVVGGPNVISQSLMDYIRDQTEDALSGQSAGANEGREGLTATRW